MALAETQGPPSPRPESEKSGMPVNRCFSVHGRCVTVHACMYVCSSHKQCRGDKYSCWGQICMSHDKYRSIVLCCLSNYPALSSPNLPLFITAAPTQLSYKLFAHRLQNAPCEMPAGATIALDKWWQLSTCCGLRHHQAASHSILGTQYGLHARQGVCANYVRSTYSIRVCQCIRM